MAEGPKRIVVDRPFTDGYVSDLPVDQLGPRMAARLENMVLHRGVAERRRGWRFHGPPTGTGPDNAVYGGLADVRYQRQATARISLTLRAAGVDAVWTEGDLKIGDLPPVASGALRLPRTVYQDELIICGQDGVTPLVRYGGAAFSRYTLSAGSVAVGERRVTGMNPAAPTGIGRGAFIGVPGGFQGSSPYGRGALYSFRISDVTPAATQLSVERTIFQVATNMLVPISPFGFAWPGVPVYGAGTLSAADGVDVTATGQGVDWGDPDNVSRFGGWEEASDAIMIFDSAGASAMNDIKAIPTATTMTITSQGNTSPRPYKVMRRMPFTDAEVYGGCLFGAGVKQHPSRLYYLPPGHDIGLSPRLADGRDGHYTGVPFRASDPVKEYETEWVDVPSSFDSDSIVALLSTAGALYVVKRNSVYRLTGSYPYFRVDKVADGCGCSDIRSAFSDDSGIYWAGRDGIWTVRGGAIVNLAGDGDRPGILNEWRRIARSVQGYPHESEQTRIVGGVTEGHLVMSITVSSAQRTFVYDIRRGRWCGEFTNVPVTAGQMIAGETLNDTKMYVMLDLSGGQAKRVVDLGSMFRTAESEASFQQGPPIDAGGATSAVMAVGHTGSSVFFPDGIGREHRLLDVGVVSRMKDTSSPTTAYQVSVAHGDHVDAGSADQVASVGYINADTVGAIRQREFRPGTRGRRQQLRIEQTAIDSTAVAAEIHEVNALIRPLGVRR